MDLVAGVIAHCQWVVTIPADGDRGARGGFAIRQEDCASDAVVARGSGKLVRLAGSEGAHDGVADSGAFKPGGDNLAVGARSMVTAGGQESDSGKPL